VFEKDRQYEFALPSSQQEPQNKNNEKLDRDEHLKFKIARYPGIIGKILPVY